MVPCDDSVCCVRRDCESIVLSPWLAEHLTCPRDGTHLLSHEEELRCDRHHAYPMVQGIPVMLLRESSPTLPYAWLELAALQFTQPELLEPLTDGIDSWVNRWIADTNGNLYRPLVGRLPRYPIPSLRLPAGKGEKFLDIGCNWGRWTIAAGRIGYSAMGIDCSLGAVLAARRLSIKLGLSNEFVVGDARCLPFANASFERVFSYSVLQHFSKADARTSIADIGRVLGPGGYCFVQMPNRYGVRNLQNQMRRRGRALESFDVRYWSPRELLRTFGARIGPARLDIDGFFGLGIQPSDIDLLPAHYRAVIVASEWLRRVATWLEPLPLKFMADSLYVSAVRPWKK